MSELKDYDILDIEAMDDERLEKSESGKIQVTRVYIKAEADKVIDFWKNESNKHYERWFNLNKQYEGWFGKVCRCERAERESRHHKYKRCLAMAKLCRSHWAANIFIHEGPDRISIHYMKWEKRWLELAEKIKEAK